MPPAFTVRAPTRIDFGGGWTDVPPYDVEQGGFVCNIAIARYASVRVDPLPDPKAAAELAVNRDGDLALLRAATRRFEPRGCRITLASDFPVAAGLGGSSAAGVATIAAIMKWQGVTKSRAEIAEASRDLEILEMGIAGGRQDHYAAAFGGALGLRFGSTVSVEQIAVTGAAAALPGASLILYTGESRISANTITAVLDAYHAGSKPVRSALARMRELAEQMVPAVSRGDFETLGHLVGEHWTHQRSLHPAIPTPLIDRIVATALQSGATGAKALGASGGGCVFIMAPANRLDEVRRAVAPMGTEIPYAVDTTGVTES